MRTRTSILSEILSRLNSQVWQRLKNGLLGRELLNYGVEVVYESEQVRNALIESLKYETADFNGLVNLAAINDVPVSAFNPSYVKVRLVGTSNVVFKPFDLVLRSGTSIFTNITYCKIGDVVTLYQGLVKTVFKNPTLTTEDFLNFRVDSSGGPWSEINIPSSDNSIYRYVVTSNAYPDSIYLLKRDVAVTAISKYTPLSYGPDKELYKVKTMPDGEVAIQLGDGFWGADSYSTDDLQLIWLELTNNEFSVVRELTSTEFNSTIDYELLSSYQGNEFDIKYARDFYKQQLLKTTVVGSVQQIREFVNGFPYVRDCAVIPIGGVVYIYIKPTDKNDLGGFDEVELALDTYGSMFVQHSASLGTPIEIVLLIRGVPESMRSVVENAIKTQYSYEALSYNDMIDAASVASFIQGAFKQNSIVRFRISMDVASVADMKFLPLEGTVRCLDAAGRVRAWDSAGTLKGITNETIWYFDIPAIASADPTTWYTYLCPVGVGDNLLVLANSKTKSPWYGPESNDSNILLTEGFRNSTAGLFSTKNYAFRDLKTQVVDALTNIDSSFNFANINVAVNDSVFITSYDSNKAWIVVYDKLAFWNYPNTSVQNLFAKMCGTIELDVVKRDVTLHDGALINNVSKFVFVNGVLLVVRVTQPGNVYIDYYKQENETLYKYFSRPITVPNLSLGVEVVLLYAVNDDLHILTSNEKLIVVRDVTTYGSEGLQIPEVLLLDCDTPLTSSEYPSIRWCLKNDNNYALMTWTDNMPSIQNNDVHVTGRFYVATGISTTQTSFRYDNFEEIFVNQNINTEIVSYQNIGTEAVPNRVAIPHMVTIENNIRCVSSNFLPIIVTDEQVIVARYFKPYLESMPTDEVYSALIECKFYKFDRVRKTEEVFAVTNTFRSVALMGTVDYLKGSIKLNNTTNISTISYESTTISEIESSSYLMLNETNPIEWK